MTTARMAGICTSLLILLLASPGASAQNWPAWRGPTGNNLAAADASPPLQWSEDRNVRWKVPLPGKGASTPAIWGDRIYVTAAIETDREGEPTGRPKGNAPAPTKVHTFVVVAYDRGSGKRVWQTTVKEAVPHERGHKTATYASASPIADGERIYAFFGSRGLYCLDLAGRILWSQDLGTMETLVGFGEGATPVVHGDLIVVPWDHQGPSLIVAFDKRTGKERWRQKRDTDSSWGSPIVVNVGKRPQVVANGSKVTRAYDLETGNPVWSCGGMSENPVTSPVAANGFVYVANSYKGTVIQAIRLDGAASDITDSDHVAWTYRQQAPYVPNALVHDGCLYFLRDGVGVLTCLDAATGKPVYAGKRLGLKSVHASPIHAAGRLYFSSREGRTAVVRAGRAFEVLATNSLDDVFDATPVAVGSELILRGRRHLYCVAAEDDR